MFIVYLLVLACWDLKEKRIPVFLLVIGMVAECGRVIFLSCNGQGMWLQTLLGITPGLVLLLVSFLTGKVGWADGIVLLVIGMHENYKISLFVLCIGLFLASLMSVTLLLLRKVKRHTTIPFIPFLSAAFCVKEVLF